jgi:hypothetical protein
MFAGLISFALFTLWSALPYLWSVIPAVTDHTMDVSHVMPYRSCLRMACYWYHSGIVTSSLNDWVDSHQSPLV